MIDIVQMKPEDVDKVMSDLAPSYWAESQETAYKGMTPSHENTKIRVAGYLEHNCAVAKDGDRIVALGAAVCLTSFFIEKEFDIDMFYIHPDYRSRGVAQGLRDAMLTMRDFHGAKLTFTSCLSGLGEENRKLFENLWAKKGFKVLGTVMYFIGE